MSGCCTTVVNGQASGGSSPPLLSSSWVTVLDWDWTAHGSVTPANGDQTIDGVTWTFGNVTTPTTYTITAANGLRDVASATATDWQVNVRTSAFAQMPITRAIQLVAPSVVFDPYEFDVRVWTRFASTPTNMFEGVVTNIYNQYTRTLLDVDVSQRAVSYIRGITGGGLRTIARREAAPAAQDANDARNLSDDVLMIQSTCNRTTLWGSGTWSGGWPPNTSLYQQRYDFTPPSRLAYMTSSGFGPNTYATDATCYSIASQTVNSNAGFTVDFLASRIDVRRR